METYILGLDQSTQGTKGVLFDAQGKIVQRVDQPHRQIVNEKGWVEHDPEEIWQNVLWIVRELLMKPGVDGRSIAAVGISNQRETAMAWDKESGKPVYPAIVWQCARGAAICDKIAAEPGWQEVVRSRTGLQLSPYFSAAKLAWILQNVPEARMRMQAHQLCMGTMDSWLVYKLTGKKQFRTDASNASRTQLFNIHTCAWDEEICACFGIAPEVLPEVMDSNACFGETDFAGLLPEPIPIHAVLGDSHAALFGQGCHQPGMVKATYGTGSSVMMHIGQKPIQSQKGLVTSLAWQFDGRPEYVLEGNINYTGAAVSWLKDKVQLIDSSAETEPLARAANPADVTYFVPAFTGLGAPYWDSQATGLFTGITRMTGKNELVRAVLDAIAYQITDIMHVMQMESGNAVEALRTDGGAAQNAYLMQLQADLLQVPVEVAVVEELSALGSAYAAGIAAGIYDQATIFSGLAHRRYIQQMQETRRQALYKGWQEAVQRTLQKF